MGNKALSPLFPTTEVSSIATNTIEVFAPIYMRAYSIELAKYLKEEQDADFGASEAAHPEQLQLENPPMGTEPLHVGWMTKLGAVKANWKRRFFVATNEADNYALFYFERESHQDTPSKRKGVIEPCGHTVRTLREDEEVKEHGANCVTVEPPLPGGRTWFLRCEDEADVDAWVEVISYAAERASPPLSRNYVARRAFATAYARTRRRLGMSGYYRLVAEEPDQLASLVRKRCEDRVLQPLLESLVGHRDEERLKRAVYAELDRVVGSVVSAAWNAVRQYAETRRTTMETSFRGSLPAQLRDMDSAVSKARDEATRFLRPIALELARPALPHILNAFLRPVYCAYKEAVIVFWNRMNTILDNGLKEKELRGFYRNIRWPHGEIHSAFRKIRALTRGEVEGQDGLVAENMEVLADLSVPLPELIEMMHGVTLWEVEVIVERSLQELVECATYTFVARVESSPPHVSAEQCLYQVARSVVHDAQKRAAQDLREAMRLIFIGPLRAQAEQIPEVQRLLRSSASYQVPVYEPQTPVTPAEADAVPREGGSAGTAASSSSDSPKPGASTRRAEKTAAHFATSACDAVSAGLADTDWGVDVVVQEVVDQVVQSGTERTVTAVLNKLNKLPGKLGFV